jgi:cell division septal protein FtsQ
MTDGFLRPGISRASRPSRRLIVLFWMLVVLAAAAGMYRYLRSPALDLERFEIEGARRARTRDVLAVLVPYQGRNLLLLNLAPITSAIEKVPWVERVTVSELPPGCASRSSNGPRSPSAGGDRRSSASTRAER